MPSKLQMITELSNETTKEITKFPGNWLKFLDTASNNYKQVNENETSPQTDWDNINKMLYWHLERNFPNEVAIMRLRLALFYWLIQLLFIKYEL